jgi:lycopene cyclase domain-containing protein
MSLYLLLELLIIAVPLILSFDKKMQFYRNWKSVLISLFFIGSIFITWDILFTRAGIWGFNPEYHASIEIFNLPIEEWLFFIVVPYASIFIHYSIGFVHPKIQLNDKITGFISIILIISFLITAISNIERIYTFFVTIISIITLLIGFLNKSKILNRYYISFVVIILPFVIFNGILTGTFIKGEVFWYNKTSILGTRLFSIPLEDIPYAFSLILLNLLCIHKIQTIFKPSLKITNDHESGN